jgi:hypothetical protein
MNKSLLFVLMCNMDMSLITKMQIVFQSFGAL